MTMYSERLEKIKNDYSKGWTQLPNFLELNDQLRKTRRIEAEQKLKESVADDLKTLGKQIDNEIQATIKKVIKIKYPLYSQTLPSERLLGITELHGAKVYLGVQRSRQKILNEIDLAYQMNRIDYLSAIVDEIVNMDAIDKKSVDLIGEVKRKARQIFSETELPELEQLKADLHKDFIAVKNYSATILHGLDKVKSFDEWKQRYDSVTQTLLN